MDVRDGPKECWAPRTWCFWIVLLEKTLESPLDCKEIHPVHPKGDQSWIFIGRTEAEAAALILWPPDSKRRLIGKDLVGKIGGRRRRGRQRMRWLDDITNTMDMGLGRLWELVMDRQAWRTVVHGVTKSQTQLSDWTEQLNKLFLVNMWLHWYQIWRCMQIHYLLNLYKLDKAQTHIPS